MRRTLHLVPFIIPDPLHRNADILPIRFHHFNLFPNRKLIPLLNRISAFFILLPNNPQIRILLHIRITIINLALMIRLPIEKSRSKLPVRTVRDLIPIPLHILLILLRALQIIINRLPIRPCHRRHIQRRLHSSFNLITVNPRIQQIRDMLNHTKIFRVKDISSSLILIHRQILPRSGLFHDRILPPARMGAGALVRISSREIIGQQTSSRVRNTHRPMNKRLDLHLLRNMLPNLFDLRQRQLPRCHDALRPLFIPELIRPIVRIVRLCTDMPLNLRAHFHRNPIHSRIRNNECIRSDLF